VEGGKSVVEEVEVELVALRLGELVKGAMMSEKKPW